MWHKPETEAFCLQSKSCGFWKLLASAVAHNFYCGDERRSPFCMTRCHASLPLDKLELVSVCRQVSIFHSNLLVTKVFTRKSQSLFFGGKTVPSILGTEQTFWDFLTWMIEDASRHLQGAFWCRSVSPSNHSETSFFTCIAQSWDDILALTDIIKSQDFDS